MESLRNPRFIERMTKIITATVMFCLAVMCINFIDTAIQRKTEISNSFNPSAFTADVRERELDCLTKNIYWEAAGEPFEGKVAVAQVTVNRANNKDFPSDICKVVYQKTAFGSKIICQFSWFCERTYMIKPVYQKEYEQAAIAARKVLFEKFRIESLDDALYYHADYVNPGWRKEKIVKIGRHIFYKG